MTNWIWSLSNGPNRRETSAKTTWDDVNETIQETTAPTNPFDIVNKTYADGNLYGLPITATPPITGQVPVLNGTADGWDWETPSGGSPTVSAQTNGVAVDAVNADVVCHDYTVTAGQLAVGVNLVYSVKLQAINAGITDLNGFYRLKLIIGGVPYDFSIEVLTFSTSGINARGNVIAEFQINNIGGTDYLDGQYTINMYDPSNGVFSTYSDTVFYNQTISLGVDDFVIESEIESSDADLTLRVVGSQLTLYS